MTKSGATQSGKTVSEASSSKPLPRPKGLSLLRRIEWILDPVTYLERTKATAPDFFAEDSLGFGAPTVVTSNPEALQYILSRDRTTFSAPGDFNRLLSPLIGDTPAIMLSGDRHKERRQLMTPAFHGERLGVYAELICALTHELVNTLPVGEPFRARDLSQKISLQTIAKVVFGLTDRPNAKDILTTMTETTEGFGSPASAMTLFIKALQKDLGAWSPWGKFLRLRAQLDELLYAEIRDRTANPDPSRTDILSMLMAARTESGDALSEQELRDELMSLLLAGHETTATAIAWAMYWIHKQPAVKAQLLTELDSLGADPSPQQIAQLPYLTAVCKETLRRSPVAMFTFPRVAQVPVDILGYHFEADTIFLGCIFLIHQQEDIYPDHTAFRPERFLERKFSPYEFVPFGNGTRRCVGEALAQYELKLAVATLVRNYRFRLADNQPEIPRRRGVTLSPARGVPMVFEGKR
ncbi:MAG: cytochrome P450 [Cyanobacteria bacterium J06607_13]